MGMADRHYEPESGGGGGFLASIPPVTKALLILNIVIHLVDVLLLQRQIRMFGAFRVESAVFEGRVWEFITFQFLHAGVIHIVFNSIGLYFFGPWMERYWGAAKFLAFYLISGIGGGVLYTVLVFAGVLTDRGIVGASAGLYGMLVGIAVIAPNLRVRLLFPPIELSMRRMAMLVLGIAVVVVITNIGGNDGGEAGHLGGAMFGYLLMKFPWLLNWCGRRDRDVEIIRPKAFSRKSEPKLRPRVDLRKDSEIDLILDKISRDGFASLTDEEREKLHKASQNQTK